MADTGRRSRYCRIKRNFSRFAAFSGSWRKNQCLLENFRILLRLPRGCPKLCNFNQQVCLTPAGQLRSTCACFFFRRPLQPYSVSSLIPSRRAAAAVPISSAGAIVPAKPSLSRQSASRAAGMVVYEAALGSGYDTNHSYLGIPGSR